MRIKLSHALLFSFMLIFALASQTFAAQSIIMNGDAHVGEQAVLSVETSQIPAGGSVEWSVSPTTGLNPDRISLRAGGRECAFTPLDTHPIRVIASFINRDGDVASSSEIFVNPKEFQIDIAVVIERPLTLWNSATRSNYVLSPDILLANSPVRLRASLNPSFKGEHSFKWEADAATALFSQDKDDIFIRRSAIGESEISVSAFNAKGVKLGSGESRVNISLPVSRFNESANEREAWQNWQRSQELWENKNYAEAVELAGRAIALAPRDVEISQGLRAMNTNYARYTKAQKLREDADNFDAQGKFDEALKNLRTAQVIWPLENGAEVIAETEKKFNEQRILIQQANWLRDTASAYDNENMYEDALEYYAKSIALVSSDAVKDRMERIRNRLTLIADADRYAGEGNSLEREGKLQEALNRYSASILSNPDATLRQHIEELQSVISRRERQANALNREAQDLMRRNNNQEALKRYTESMNVWPTDTAEQRIRQLNRNTRLPADAVIRGPEDFGIGTRLDAQKITQEADELYSQGNLDEALALYRKAQNIAPSDEMRRWIVRLDAAVKERDAVNNANRMINEANALFKAGKTNEAINLYRESLKVHKNSEIEEFIRKQAAGN
ncbi:MAG: tetratricopeptide repeat protein [Synergistaceae bacterium]|nr:tetratricopeptide repeat protein [Synergistaceae bacterium]